MKPRRPVLGEIWHPVDHDRALFVPKDGERTAARLLEIPGQVYHTHCRGQLRMGLVNDPGPLHSNREVILITCATIIARQPPSYSRPWRDRDVWLWYSFVITPSEQEKSERPGVRLFLCPSTILEDVAFPDATVLEQFCLHRELLSKGLISGASAACQHRSPMPWELAQQLSFRRAQIGSGVILFSTRSAERHVNLTLQDRFSKLCPPEDSQRALDFSTRLFPPFFLWTHSSSASLGETHFTMPQQSDELNKVPLGTWKHADKSPPIFL